MPIRHSSCLTMCLPFIAMLLPAVGPVLQAQVPGTHGAADARSRESAQQHGGVWHVVQPGQTVYGISKANQLPIQALLDANPQLEGYALRIGDSLWLPAAPQAGEAVEAPKAQSTEVRADAVQAPAETAEAPPRSSLAGENTTTANRETAAAEHPSEGTPGSGTEPPVRAGRWYVLGEGETLFALAANLKVPLSELLALNPGLDHRRLKAGQQIRVPLDAEGADAPSLPRSAQATQAEPHAAPQQTMEGIASTKPAVALAYNGEADTARAAAAPAPTSRPASTAEPAPSVHTVRQGETWYGIARQHGVALETLQKANPEHRAGLKPGTALRLPTGGRAADASSASPKGARPYAAPAPSIPVHWPRERGLATYLSDSSPASTEAEALALHNGAPVGTRITVRNLMNNRSVEARVVGPLPNTAAQNRTVVTLSPQAAKALGAHDPRVLVEVAWPPEGAPKASGAGEGQEQTGQDGGR